MEMGCSWSLPAALLMGNILLGEMMPWASPPTARRMYSSQEIEYSGANWNQVMASIVGWGEGESIFSTKALPGSVECVVKCANLVYCGLV